MILGQEATNEQIAELQHVLRLDLPLHVQYFHWIKNVLQGDFGTSFRYGTPVAKELASRFPATLLLAISGVVITLIIGIPLGILSAVKQNSWTDHLVLICSLIGVSMPIFLLGFLLIWGFSYYVPLFPTSGYGDLRFLILPALTVGLSTAAEVTRLTRTSMLEVLRQDYIRTARAKGLSSRIVLIKHALKNAMIPVVTVAALQLGLMLAGTVITESLFGIPGMGRLIVDAISARDYAVVQGVLLFIVVIFIVLNFLTDMLYAWLDPRIRFN